MGSLTNIKLEPHDEEFETQVDHEDDNRNGEFRDSSSLVASIPVGRPEMEEATPTGPVDILQEASRISSEVTRLVGELALCKVRCSEKESELEKCRERIDIQNEQLQQAEELISSLQTQLEEMEGTRSGDCEIDRVDLREMKTMVATEREEKIALQTKFDKLKSSMEQFSKEFVCVVSKVKEFSREGNDADEEDYEDIPLQENKLEGIMEYAKNKFQKWAENQEKIKSELKTMTQVVQTLAGVLDADKCGAQSSVRRSSERIVRKTVISSPPPKKVPLLPKVPVIKTSPKKAVIPRGQFVTTETVGLSSSPQEKSMSSRRAQHHGVDETKRGKGYFCICGVQYSTGSNLKTHIRSFTGKGKFTCPQCGLRFVHLYVLRRHQRDRHKIIVKKTSWGCTECGKMFPSQLTFTRHRKREHTARSKNETQFEDEDLPENDQDHSGDMEWEDIPETIPVITNVVSTSKKFRLAHGYCATDELACLCGRRFPHPNGTRKHVKYYTSQRNFSCDQCSKRFVNASQLREHQRRAHKIISTKTKGTGCRKCGALFPTWGSFHKHRKECSGQAANLPADEIEPVTDETEGQRVNFSGKQHGMNIGRRHQGFYCICGDKFISRKRLDGHVEFFNRGRPKYREVESENEEDEDSQIEEPDLQYQDYEEEEDQYEENLEQLQLPEENEPQPSTSKASASHAPHPSRANECLCGYKGSNRANLGKHIKYYTGDKVFKCEYCPDAFNDVCYLRKHILRLHKHVTLEQLNWMRTGCRRCGKLFPGKKSLRRHLTIEHGVQTGSSSATPEMSRKRTFVYAGPSSDKRESLPEKMFTCPQCDNIGFPMLHRLNKHMKLVHGIASKLIIGCRDCGIGFSQRKFHSQHRISVHGSAIGKPKQKQLTMNVANSSMALQYPDDQYEYEFQDQGETEEVVHENAHAAFVEEETSPIPIPITIEDDDDPQGFIDTYVDVVVPKEEAVPEEQPQFSGSVPGAGLLHTADFCKTDGVYKCSCGETFTFRTNLMAHIKQQQPDQLKFPCHLCDLRFLFPSVLNRHLVRTHKINQSTAPKPGPSSQVIVELPRHGTDVSKASRGYFCLCGKNCSSERALKLHIVVASRETSPRRKAHAATSGWTKKRAVVKKQNFRKLWCQPCGKYFKDRSTHYQHMKTFHKKKYPKVEGPQRVLRRIPQPQLSLGVQPTHMDATVEGGPPTCSCGREYLTTSGLAKHIRLKNRGNLFQCSWCDKDFGQNGQLRQHCEKVHKKIIPEGAQVCGVCHQICESLSALAKHRRDAHYM